MTKMRPTPDGGGGLGVVGFPRDDAGDLLVEQVELPLALLADGGKVLGIVAAASAAWSRAD